jgi:hypothetical protein
MASSSELTRSPGLAVLSRSMNGLPADVGCGATSRAGGDSDPAASCLRTVVATDLVSRGRLNNGHPFGAASEVVYTVIERIPSRVDPALSAYVDICFKAVGDIGG